jgi:hypothetical protein
MPIDLLVKYKDGSEELIYIPLNEMMGSKPKESSTTRDRTYTLALGKSYLYVYPSNQS